MTKSKSAVKRVGISKKRYQRNHVYKAATQTALKNARKAISKKQKDEAPILVDKAIQALDKAAAKGVIHKNNAARRKSRLIKALHTITT